MKSLKLVNKMKPGERFYKDTLITHKKNKVIFQGELMRDF